VNYYDDLIKHVAFQAKVDGWLANHPTCEACSSRSERVVVVEFVENGLEKIRLGTFCRKHDGESKAAS
jgi:hypothetical protein